jgi:hypothetical protein
MPSIMNKVHILRHWKKEGRGSFGVLGTETGNKNTRLDMNAQIYPGEPMKVRV